MLNLDKIEALPDYQVILAGKTLTFKVAETIDKLGSASTADLASIPRLVEDVFGLTLEMHQALALLKDFDTFSRQFEKTLLFSTSFMADMMHYYHLSPTELQTLSPRLQLGLHSNIRRLHTLHVLEQATAIAMIFKPAIATDYIQRLKVFQDGDGTASEKIENAQEDADVVEWKSGTADLHTSETARRSLIQTLGL